MTVVECCAVARWLRERLSADGLLAYGKTSGSKGLHLLVPLEPTPSQEVTAYAKRLAVEAEAELPALVVHRMKRELRPGKVFVDFSQNAAAKTTATPYTLRARREPAVSAPVTWEEIQECRSRGSWSSSRATWRRGWSGTGICSGRSSTRTVLARCPRCAGGDGRARDACRPAGRSSRVRGGDRPDTRHRPTSVATGRNRRPRVVSGTTRPTGRARHARTAAGKPRPRGEPSRTWGTLGCEAARLRSGNQLRSRAVAR